MNNRYLAIADIVGRVCICLYFIPALITRVIFIQQTFARDDLTSIDVVTIAAKFCVRAVRWNDLCRDSYPPPSAPLG